MVRITALFCLLVICFCVSCSADNTTLKNRNIELDFSVNNNVVSLEQVINVKDMVSYIAKPDPEYSIWTFSCKKSKDYAGEEIKLSPSMAEKFDYKSSDNQIEFKWSNVKDSQMATGFDVTVTVNIVDENSYWDINISENLDYGLWDIVFPKIPNIENVTNKIILPRSGGSIEKNVHGGLDLDYPGLPATIQLSGVTDGKDCLYLCPEDLNGNYKIFSYKYPNPDYFRYFVTNKPADMGLGGVGYKQDYKFNMAVLCGDHYDACKKYRKWGIENNFAPFSKGLIENRKDLPRWWKDNCVWIQYDAPAAEFCGKEAGKGIFFENTKSAVKFLDTPIIIHLYWWSQNRFDTHYPNMLPALSYIKPHLDELKAMPGVKIMPYTNALLTDAKNSDYYKEYGDDMLAIKADGSKYGSEFSNDFSWNLESCPNGSYPNAYNEEIKKVMKELDFDVEYYDQMCAEAPRLCFNPLHKHPLGGGKVWADGYKALIERNRKDLSEIKGTDVPCTSESSLEAYPVDGWLRCNETFPTLEKEPLTSYIYSGYVMSFGDRYYDDEWTTDDSLPAINKTASSLCKGIQLGWNLGGGWRTITLENEKNEFDAYPKFGEYFKRCVEARTSAKEYFNLGEMVRKVTFTEPMATKNILWHIWGFQYHEDFPLVRTCSYNYKGKTMVCFASISDEEVEFTWKAKASDLNLKTKKNYKISQIYPTKKAISNKALGGKVKMEPLEVKILIVE